MRTYQTRTIVDEQTCTILSSYADLFARIEHHLFKAKILNIDLNICKRNFLKQFGITARQFNACHTILQGKIDSIKERRNGQIIELEEKIKALEVKIKRIRNLFTIHQKKRRLSHLKAKLTQLKVDKDQNTIRLCFGSKKLFHAQYALNSTLYILRGR